jgi:hypothetical protein
LEVINGPTVSFSTSTTLEEQLVSPPKVNYFANLPSDSDKSNDEFDLCTNSYPSNSSNIYLSHTRILTHFESSSNILKTKILELEKMISIYQSNMDEFEITKNELSKCKSENIILNVQIQTLKTENRALKTSSDLRDITNLDLELIYGTRRSHDKSDLGYVKDSTLSNSKPKKSPRLKGKQSKNIFTKNVKSSIDRNDKPNNHAYQYRYTNMKNTKTTFRTKCDNRIYYRGHNGWSYDIENKKVFQKIDKSNVAPQQSKKVQTNMISKGKANLCKFPKTQELTSHFKSHFVQEKNHIPTKIFYNYCCKIGHISLDYDFRKRSNKNVVWVSKVIS